MQTASARFDGRDFDGRDMVRRYTITYRAGGSNHCPGCGGTQWHVGRQTAECAYCCTALPLADPADRRPMTLMPTIREAWRPFAAVLASHSN